MAALTELPSSALTLKNDPETREPDDSADADLDGKMASFRTYARERYDDLFEELEFRCQRAAMMHYHEANRFSSRCCNMELTATLLGAASVSGIGAFLLKFNKDKLMSSTLACPFSRLGLFGILGVVLSALLEFASKGSSKLIPSLCKRAATHKKAAVGWQKLTRLTRSYRIQLRNPSLTVDDYLRWYADLVRQRQTVSAVAMVPSRTYRAFNDPGRVFAALRKKRQMFLRFHEMIEGKEEVNDEYDDD